MYKLITIFLFSSMGWLSCEKQSDFPEVKTSIQGSGWRYSGGGNRYSPEKLLFGTSQVNVYNRIDSYKGYCYERNVHTFSVNGDRITIGNILEGTFERVGNELTITTPEETLTFYINGDTDNDIDKCL